MTEILRLAALGGFAGTYGAIIGAGGGFIIVPILLFFFGFDVAQTVGTSLIAVFSVGLSGSIGYARQKRMDYALIMTLAAGAVPGAITGTLIARLIHVQAFSGLLGVVLTVIGVLTIFWGSAPANNSNIRDRRRLSRRIVDYAGHKFEYLVDIEYGLGICFLGGLMASLFGIGGGVIIVPALIFLQRIPHPMAVSTSSGILTISSLTAIISYSLQNTVEWPIALPLAFGAVLGGQAGSWVNRRLARPWVIRLLSLALLFVGGRMLLGAFRGL